LGIDPGTNIMGYGVIRIVRKKPELVTAGVIDMKKMDDHFLKLKMIFDRVTGLIETYHPDELAIEAPFFGKNVQSMLKLGRAQGAAIAAGLQHTIPIFEYAPRKIKMSLTGTGSASKEQVAALTYKLLSAKDLDLPLDATDGLAAAVCHYFQTNKPAAAAEYKSWKDFIGKNKDRIK